MACLHRLPFPPLKRPGFRERFFYIIKLCVMTGGTGMMGTPAEFLRLLLGARVTGQWSCAKQSVLIVKGEWIPSGTCHRGNWYFSFTFQPPSQLLEAIRVEGNEPGKFLLGGQKALGGATHTGEGSIIPSSSGATEITETSA